MDCGGRFEIGSTGRVKGSIKTQVLVVKEGAHWEGGVTMTREPGARPTPQPGANAQQGAAARPSAQSGGGIFSKGEKQSEAQPAPQREGQPAGQSSSGGGQ